MRFAFSVDSYRFFDQDGYPFDLDLVAERDGIDRQIGFVRRFCNLSEAIVLDAGCGFGRFSGPVQRLGAFVVAVDVVQEGLRLGLFRHPGVSFVCANLGALPFLGSQFDYVLSLYTSLGYVPGGLKAELAEIRRVTRSGGVLILDLQSGTAPYRRFGREELRDGTGFWWKSRFRERMVQWTLAIGSSGIGLFKLSYPALTRESVSEVLTAAAWKPTWVFGDYDCRAYDDTAPRLIVICEAI